MDYVSQNKKSVISSHINFKLKVLLIDVDMVILGSKLR